MGWLALVLVDALDVVGVCVCVWLVFVVLLRELDTLVLVLVGVYCVTIVLVGVGVWARGWVGVSLFVQRNMCMGGVVLCGHLLVRIC